MKTKLLSLILLGLLYSNIGMSQMTYVNEDWSFSNGDIESTNSFNGTILNDHIQIASEVDPFGNLVYVSNHYDGSSHTNILLNSVAPSGTLNWQKIISNSTTDNEWGTDLKIDATGNIYICGVAHNFNQDYYIAKYNSSGSQLWQQTFNGTGNGDDRPIALDLDGSGNVFVTGTTFAGISMTDITTIKYNTSGVQQWVQHYDFADTVELAADIAVNSAGDIVVTGASANNAVNSDFVVIKYNNNGNPINVQRFASPGNGHDFPMEMALDTADNIFIVGGSDNGSQYDIKVLAVSNSLNTLWTQYIDQDELDDIGMGIEVDVNNDISITGYVTKSNQGQDLITIKYASASGDEIWRSQKACLDPTESAIGTDIASDNSGNIYVTGVIHQNGTNNYITRKINPDGDVTFEKFFLGNQNSTAAGREIVVKNSDVFALGVTAANPAHQQITIQKYRTDERALNHVNIDGVDSHIDDEIIVNFGKDHVINSIIDNKNLTFGTLDEFVTPPTIQALNSIEPSIEWNKVKTYKIFKGMTTADTVSITRTGFQIDIPSYWSTLILSIPNQNEVSIANAIDTLGFPYTQHVQINELYEFTTNDPEYTVQHSLYPNTYPNADINAVTAWNYETGKSNILVGVYDTGIRYSHDDLSHGKVAGGKDYYTGTSLYSVTDNGDPISSANSSGHGTKVAGIIGAYRNNSIGIAGIAGGNWPYNTAASDGIINDPQQGEDKGVTLYGFRIIEGPSTLSADVTASALIEGTVNMPSGYGYGLDILNCSFTKTFDDISTVTHSYNLMYNAQRTAFRNGSVLVAGKGNDGTPGLKPPAYALKESWVIAVGGSNTLGNWHSSASYGEGIDIVAPFSNSLTRTTSNGSDTDYSNFSGTSCSTPHVSGVAALMLSHINDQTSTINNLAPDDVEFLIENYASDILPAGYDDKTGFGLIDAGNVMQHIDKSQYVVQHFYGTHTVDLNTATCLSGNCNSATVTFNNFKDLNHPIGTYKGAVWEISGTHNYTLNPGDVILNSWPLNSHTNLRLNPTTNNNQEHYEAEMEISNVSNTSTDWNGTIIHVLEDPNGNPVDFWYPVGPGDVIKYGFTLHYSSNYASVDEVDDPINFVIYPNPAKQQISVTYRLTDESLVSMELTDINGKNINTIFSGETKSGQQIIDLDVSELSQGIYFLRIAIGEKIYYEKFIKQ